MRKTFTMEYWQDEDWYVGQLRKVPGVFSQGETLTELEENIRDAFELVLEDSGKPVFRTRQDDPDLPVPRSRLPFQQRSAP